jgi:hypothetical protein
VTSPAPVGFPDWQRTFAAARNVLVNIGPRAIVAPDVTGPIPTVNMKSILIDLNTSVNNASLLIEWFIDKAATVSLTQDVIDVRTNIFFEQTVAVKGPFARFTVEPMPGATCTYFLLVSESADNNISQVDADHNILIQTEEVSIAAGATRTDRPIHVMAAPASFFAFSLDAASWECLLSIERADNSTSLFAYASNKTTPLPQSIYLPACPFRVDTTNHDGAARTFIIAVLAKPLYP